jgi:pimeloyl-ACP methyl ester carboxylesterase
MAKFKAGQIEIHVVEQGRGKPLLLAHGYPLDHSMWRGQLAGLADQCRVIAPDLRGFGATEVVAGTATMEQMADDLAALLDALGIAEPVTFCGLSMGGYVAWQFALRHRERLARLVLCDTRSIADSPETITLRHKTAERVLKEGPAIAAAAIIPKLFAKRTYDEQPALIEATQQTILRTEAEGIAAALRGMAARPDVTPRLAEINVPALVVCGEHDAISPPAEMRDIASRLPRAQFIEIPQAGHMAPLEQPAAVNDAIRRFLAA